MSDRVREILGDQYASLLEHKSEKISQDMLHLPGPDFVDRVMSQSDR
ncbi:MAG: fructose-bisphosphate aldolase, partial [Acidimicrobiia bacterium]|nr:fructose-bisphosphate aldolase [Acidimicrobiia bacterium]